jgi:hypothetical protein
MSNPQVKSELEAFAVGIREWLPALKWLARTVISIRTEPDLIILQARAALLFDEPRGPLRNFALETKSLSVIADAVPMSRSVQEDLMSNLEQGRLRIGGRTDHLLRLFQSHTFHVSAFHSPFFHPSQPGGSLLPTLFLSAANRTYVYQTVRGGQQVLDWELKAADTPFASLEELSRVLGFDPTGEARLELTAHFPGVISNASSLTKGTAEIHANVAPGMDESAFKLGYVAYKAGANPVRKHLTGEQADWVGRNEYNEAVFTFDVGDFPHLALYLSYKGTVVHEASIADPRNPSNPRQVAYEAVDPELANLRKYLLSHGKSPESDLEFAIACVFHLVGMSALRFGDMEQFRNFSDVVGVTPSGRIVVAEVTIGPIDANGKLSKLAGRAFQIRDSLQQIGAINTDVIPMIVTAFPREAISGDLEKAGRAGICVVAKEDLLTVASQRSFALDAEKAYDLFKKQVPSTSIKL